MIHSNLHPVLRSGRSATDGRGAPIALRSAEEIEAIARTGRIVASALDAGRDACVVGATTASISEAVATILRSEGAEPLSLGARPDPELGSGGAFPAAACVSVDDVILHGVPGKQVLLGGELVSIDVAARFQGWCADAAITIPAGRLSEAKARLLAAMNELLETAIDLVRPGVRWSTIAGSMQEMAIGSGYGLVEGFTGHGVGETLHEAPVVPSQLTAGLLGREDFTLRPGMVLAIEPTLVETGPISGPGTRADGTASGVPVVLDPDGWSVRTLDGAVAAHAEHTIVVDRRGGRVLTGLDARTDCFGGADRIAAALVD